MDPTNNWFVPLKERVTEFSSFLICSTIIALATSKILHLSGTRQIN